MATYLDRIVEHHRERAAADHRDVDALIAQCAECAPARPFRDALTASSSLSVIAEVKRRSPSKGDLSADLDPAELAQRYELGGASCLSVLTDEPHFGGSAEDLRTARNATRLPVIRKDFTVAAIDVVDARLMGADCVLLIVAALSDAEIAEFASLAVLLGMAVLTETHDEAEVVRALEYSAGAMIGVNQRDLETFQVDQARAVRVARAIPPDVVKVAESGVRGPDDAAALADAGYDAVLVGEYLVTSSDPTAAITGLRAARR